ncbi:MAG: ATP-binding protein [bacterium]
MYNSENLQEKWQPVLNHPDLPEITDAYKRAVTSVILENQEREMNAQQQMLAEADMTTGAVANFNPVLISLVRRAMPNLMAYDVCGVQPMTGPTGLIFAMKARYGGGSTSNTEALFDGAQTQASGKAGIAAADGAEPGLLNDSGATAPSQVQGDIGTGTVDGDYNVRPGMATSDAEALTGGSTASGFGGVANSLAQNAEFQDMGFTIEQSQVTARSRALRAGYTMELAQDLKAIHGLDAESELSNILSTEILAEINREVVRSIYTVAKEGAAGTTDPGIFDLDTDSNGRWSVEKFKGLVFQIERDANAISIETRRGKGNILMCSADVASALSMAGTLDVGGSMGAGNLSVDTSGSTFAGTIGGRIKVYVDPYESLASGSGNWYVAGYRGASAYDAGLFYCPYVPLQMVRAVGENDFQPKIAFKTRYGMAENPFARAAVANNVDVNALAPNLNTYYRRARVNNIM